MSRYRNVSPGDWKALLFRLVPVLAAVVVAAVYLGGRHPLLFFLCAAALLLMLVRWQAGAFGYRCSICRNEFSISIWRDLVSPHIFTTKLLRCPRCGQRGWAKLLARVRSPRGDAIEEPDPTDPAPASEPERGPG